ncbi:MAG: efflux RND transporter periplasmic adaptor subunit [Betaproteobacteria bacterium]|nr:efflux RND transporter periplasmic adaptor subunit [Betaproteobacteria bacterium]MDH3438349.1 efflux RND transporter periplasmic adaptor subunit [Betaproteobacteria bacterium]
MKRLVLLLVVVGLLTAVGLYWKRSTLPSAGLKAAAPANRGPMGLPVKAGTVRTGTIVEEVSAVGTLLANESVMIRPERDGRIAQIHFAEGQLVKRGVKLVSLDASETEAQLAAISAEAKLNRSRLKRAEELKEKSFISAEALDVARETLNQSVARRAEVKSRLEKMTILAPFDGVAGLRQVSPGAYVRAGQDIARLEGIGTLKLDFRVPELYLGRIRPEQEVEVRVDAFSGDTFRGAIYALEPAVDEQSRTVLLRAHVPNPDVRLKPGMFARVLLVLGTRKNALLVPEQALVPRGNDNFVFRIVDNKAVLSKVELGLRRPGQVEITKGLTAGEQIVVDGQLKLRPGVPVKVLAEKPQESPPPRRQEGRNND